MDHPAIAKVFDAGATPDGQPYFVMEYVPGTPITEYCDQKKLSIHERLKLFMKVCGAVQHAHQKAIIHRDLKPANILVADVDGEPMPRIIDFGLAKAVGTQSAETLFTQVWGVVGTPSYMSPEQATPNHRDIDTRTDVYSLGVILYVLLTGALPFDGKQWQEQQLDEVLRQLREQDPPRPSAKVESEEKLSGVVIAQARGVAPGELAMLLRGDLDCITMKCLEKDRARRYGTASELAADIERYLIDQPVLARPATFTYKTRKYVYRHRIAVGAVAGLVLLLAGFAVLQATQLRRVARERDRANRITDFMKRMFKVYDPSQARGNSITVREVLDKASKQIDAGLAKDPETQGQLMDVMGDVYESVGLYPQAQPLLERAVDIERYALGPNNSTTLSSMDDLAVLLDDEGKYAQAEKLDRETLDIRRRVLGPDHPDTLASMRHLVRAVERQGRLSEAEKLGRETLSTERRVLGPEDPGTLATLHNLAWILQHEGHYAEAEKIGQETIEIRSRVLGPDHPDTLESLKLQAATFLMDARYADAEKLGQEALELQRRVFGPEHPSTLATMHNLVLSLSADHRDSEAEGMAREVVEIQSRVLGPEHPNTLNSINTLIRVLDRERNYGEAEKLARQVIVIDRRVAGPEHPNTLTAITNLAVTLEAEGKHSEAEKFQRQALEIQRRVLGPDHPQTAESTYNVGVIVDHLGRRTEALALLREAVDHGLPPNFDLEMSTDPDLKSMHGDARFAALVAYAKEVAQSKTATAQKP
jgi:eukaryotic-like serine/threonine-protein kinase